jgi:hypothetical protein
MPTKNWLIRTKSNHILGPVSKEKVIELYHNGSVRPEDEICSGNGFWFFLREKDQVEHYLLGNKKQSFNPMSEGIDVLTATSERGAQRPDDDITMVGGINLSELKDTPAAPPKPRSGGSVQVRSTVDRAPAIVATEVIEAPPEEEPEAALREAVAQPVIRVPTVPTPTPIIPGKGKRKALTPATNIPLKPLPQRKFSDRLVMVSAVVVLLVLAGVLYYRKRILQEFIQSAYTVVVPEAMAQAPEFKSKKKIFLSPSP